MFGRIVQRERQRRKMSRRDLALASRYSTVTIWRIETGKAGTRPSLESVERIARGLGMTPQVLLNKIGKDGRAA